MIKYLVGGAGLIGAAYFIGQFIGAWRGKRETMRLEDLRARMEKVKRDAAKGDDVAVLEDFRRARDPRPTGRPGR